MDKPFVYIWKESGCTDWVVERYSSKGEAYDRERELGRVVNLEESIVAEEIDY